MQSGIGSFLRFSVKAMRIVLFKVREEGRGGLEGRTLWRSSAEEYICGRRVTTCGEFAAGVEKNPWFCEEVSFDGAKCSGTPRQP